MICLTGFVTLMLIFTAEARVGDSSQLNFCSETEQCLLFDSICNSTTYEVRHYESVKWVSTDYKTFSMELMMFPSFWRLYGYITGENEEGKKIDMTAPVLIKIPEKKMYKQGVFTMSFLLPAEYQNNPPQPTNKDVYIQEMPAMNVYVRSHGDMMHTFADNKHCEELSSALRPVNAKYEKGFHYGAGYNRPSWNKKCHSEVWYVVEGDPVCNNSEADDQNPEP
ncbi:heme-binding protein 2 [Cyprinodon tularosa]|uniref:heme-binding protein 2 n=1 Tax=Cyprinodon tularosa TaxID=77115 RepID=UPI0018E20DC6|nr:heme-binding protein 2 [Cyprinodon tularosa]